MSDRKMVEVDLPAVDANEMSARAAMEGIDPRKYMGIQTLKGFKGVLHPDVVEFETRATQGHPGTNPDDRRG